MQQAAVSETADVRIWARALKSEFVCRSGDRQPWRLRSNGNAESKNERACWLPRDSRSRSVNFDVL